MCYLMYCESPRPILLSVDELIIVILRYICVDNVVVLDDTNREVLNADAIRFHCVSTG